MEKVGIPCERYSRTCGYFAEYTNLNRGKKSERDERVLLKVPEPEAVPYRASTRKFNTL